MSLLSGICHRNRIWPISPSSKGRWHEPSSHPPSSRLARAICWDTPYMQEHRFRSFFPFSLFVKICWLLQPPAREKATCWRICARLLLSDDYKRLRVPEGYCWLIHMAISSSRLLERSPKPL